MRVIWKTILRGNTPIKWPTGSRPLSVQVQDDRLTVWFLCDPDAPYTFRQLALVGTGMPLPESIETWEYVGTVQQPPWVWHLFLAP